MTVLLGAVMVCLLTFTALQMRVAYVALGPGRTVDALGEYQYVGADEQVHTATLITADPEYSSDSEGQLRLVTVEIHDRIDLVRALYYWIHGDYAVIPREFQYPDDRDREEIQQEQRQMWVNSQSSAETAALRALGYPVSLLVTSVDAESPSHGELVNGDVITEVAGEEVTSQQRLVELLTAEVSEAPGETIPLTVDRDGEAEAAEVVPEEMSDGTVVLPGVTVEPVQEDPFGLEVNDDEIGIGGPSAGLVFALAMIDRVTPEDLTGGLVVAGTGEIDEDGNVGAIGGVAQKVVGAKEDGATVFLTPADNCATAKANAPDGLLLVKVDTLDGALDALTALRDGGTPPTC
ncbi:PDZ domain-containing protein [Stackebrandtia albiflava]